MFALCKHGFGRLVPGNVGQLCDSGALCVWSVSSLRKGHEHLVSIVPTVMDNVRKACMHDGVWCAQWCVSCWVRGMPWSRCSAGHGTGGTQGFGVGHGVGACHPVGASHALGECHGGFTSRRSTRRCAVPIARFALVPGISESELRFALRRLGYTPLRCATACWAGGRLGR